MISSYILSLESADATLALVGGKGESLGRLARAGFLVPGGFHVTTVAYREFIAANHIEREIEAAAAAASPNEPASLDCASASIQSLILRGTIPCEITAAIRSHYAEMGADVPVAVRSSATAEDLPGMSFAGQQETYLNVRGTDAVVAAVQRCWASLWTSRAIGYRAKQRISSEGVAIAVVVQKLIMADVAGILFTANPVTGARDEMVINAAWGLGEAVVSGLVTPDTFVVNRKTGVAFSQDIAVKEIMTVRSETGTREHPVPEGQRRAATLGPNELGELIRAGESIEKLFGTPSDIEWAFGGSRLFVLQARPITALPEPRTVLDWTLPRARGRYARSSVIELMPEPLTPLFISLGLPGFNEAMRGLFERTMGLGGSLPATYQLVTINDFAYYDFGANGRELLRILARVPRAIPKIYRMILRAHERWNDEARPAYAELTARWTARDLREVPTVELLDGAKDICRLAGNYYVTIQSGILPVAYGTEALFTKLYDRLAKRRGDPAAPVFLLGIDNMPMQSEKSLFDLAVWARGQDGLRGYLENTPSAEISTAFESGKSPVTEADVWHEFHRRLSEHLDRFGNSIYDLDFAKCLPVEDPVPTIETLRYFLSGQARNPHERQVAAAAAREAASAALLARLGFLRRPVLDWLLGIAQRFSPERENALADVGLGWLVLRRMLREAGRRCVDAGCIGAIDDVFWLEYGEIALAEPGMNYSALVAERRAKWERERKATPPVMLPLEKGARLMGIDMSGSLPARTGQTEGASIRGVGSSPGQVTGVARVIHGTDEFSLMKPGDILIAKVTTPAWTPLFALAAGIVTDVGGPLSHSSIVAREYQIPAVLGTGVATERIRNGQRVVVDGDAGVVELLKSHG
jgi:pyruvate,water dikinase